MFRLVNFMFRFQDFQFSGVRVQLRILVAWFRFRFVACDLHASLKFGVAWVLFELFSKIVLCWIFFSPDSCSSSSPSPMLQFPCSRLELCLRISGLQLHLSQIRIGFVISRFAFPVVTLVFFVSELDARPSLTDFALALFDTVRCCARSRNFMLALLTIYAGIHMPLMLFMSGLFWNL